MKAKIQEVATAIASVEAACERGSGLDQPGKHEAMARAALSAMREPSTDMLKAGVSAYEAGGKGFLLGAYKAMIWAAMQ